CDLLLDLLLVLHMLDRPLGRGFRHHLLGSGGNLSRRRSRRDRYRRKLDHNCGRALRRRDLVAPGDHPLRDRAVREDDDRSADRPAAQIGDLFGAERHHCVFSSPTSATFRYPAARKRFMTSIISPYGTALSARRKMRVSLSPFAAASSVPRSRSRLTGFSPSASVRSDLTVR